MLLMRTTKRSTPAARSCGPNGLRAARPAHALGALAPPRPAVPVLKRARCSGGVRASLVWMQMDWIGSCMRDARWPGMCRHVVCKATRAHALAACPVCSPQGGWGSAPAARVRARARPFYWERPRRVRRPGARTRAPPLRLLWTLSPQSLRLGPTCAWPANALPLVPTPEAPIALSRFNTGRGRPWRVPQPPSIGSTTHLKTCPTRARRAPAAPSACGPRGAATVGRLSTAPAGCRRAARLRPAASHCITWLRARARPAPCWPCCGARRRCLRWPLCGLAAAALFTVNTLTSSIRRTSEQSPWSRQHIYPAPQPHRRPLGRCRPAPLGTALAAPSAPSPTRARGAGQRGRLRVGLAVGLAAAPVRFTRAYPDDGSAAVCCISRGPGRPDTAPAAARGAAR